MKLKNIFMALLAGAFVTVGCVEEKIEHLEGLEVSNSYVGIEAKGGSTEVTFDATAAWEIDVPSSADWLTVDPLTGNEGSVKVHFSAEEAELTRKCEVKVYVDLTGEGLQKDEEGNYTGAVAVQHINVIQSLGATEPDWSTCKQVVEDKQGGKTYFVKDATVKEISQPKYGNLTLTDDSGKDLKVYGTLDKNGEEGNFASWGISVGDKLTLYGPWDAGHSNLKNITVTGITKALLKLHSDKDQIDFEHKAGILKIPMTVKGPGVDVKIEDGVDWLSFQGVDINGTTAVAKFAVSEYTDAEPRFANLNFYAERMEKQLDGTEKLNKTDIGITLRQIGVVPDPISIHDAVTSNFKKYVTIDGTVMAINTDGYIIYDGIDYLFINSHERPNVKIGQKVKASGKIGDVRYAKNYEMYSPFTKIIDKTEAEVKHPTPTVVTTDYIDKLVAKTAPKATGFFVTVKGKPIEKKGGMIFLDEEMKYAVDAYHILPDFIYSDYYYYDDVVLEGYVIQTKSAFKDDPNQLRIVVTSIKSAKFDAE